MNDQILKYTKNLSLEEILEHYHTIEAEAEAIRNSDKKTISAQFENFYARKLNIGIGYQRSYGSILSGDYYELFKLPDGNYLFVFADISGHGLPAYTTLIRLRCAIALTVKEFEVCYNNKSPLNIEKLIFNIGEKFTDIMDSYNSHDFASVVFTSIRNENDMYHLRFFSRGMHFPFIVRKFQNVAKDVYDLNTTEKGWIPRKGHLLGSEIRKILGEKYNDYPNCEFVLYEGDTIMYFSDGIIEATDVNNTFVEFGTERLKALFIENVTHHPSIIINNIFDEITKFIGQQRRQEDDMTAVIIDFPLVR